MTTGRFGPFGGQYIPETLMNEIQRPMRITRMIPSSRRNSKTYWTIMPTDRPYCIMQTG